MGEGDRRRLHPRPVGENPLGRRRSEAVGRTKKTRHRWRAFQSVDDEGELALAGLKATKKN